MNQNPQRTNTIAALMDAIEMVKWRGEKVPGVRLEPGQEYLIVQIRRALRELHPEYPAVAVYFPRDWVDDEEGWKFYPREESPSRFGNRKGCKSMDRITDGLGGK